MVNKDNVLSVEDLTVSFGERVVVEGLNYTLAAGKTLGIVGESGSGKSVSSLALMGLLPRTAHVTGCALLQGNDLLAMDEQSMRAVRGHRIAMIFQEPMTSLNPVQKCGAQVMELVNDRQRVLDLFAEVLLPNPVKVFNSYPHELSGGQKQRVMIAMALITNPDIIIADEPTTALDVTVQKTILRLLRDLQQRHGTAILFITHDLGVISEVADEVLVMYRGQMVENGSATEVLHHPQHAYTRGLLACRPPLDSHPRRLPTVQEFLEHGEQSVQSSSSCPQQSTVPTSTTPLLSVRDLTVEYTLKRNLWGKPLQTLKAVDGVSFDIMEGETLGLVGESGCGKSTLGRTLLRLQQASNGTVVYKGQRIDSLGTRQMRPLRSQMQLVFQDPYSSLNPRLTIGDAIAEPLRVRQRGLSHSECRAQVEAMMQQVGLELDWYCRYPHQLSGGQRQRVVIARALILRPEFVVCDESVSALDVSVQAQVLNLLNDLKDQFHYTYLFITHDMSVVHYMADRIMVMQRGRIVETGSPDVLFHTPQTDYTRTLIDALPRIR